MQKSQHWIFDLDGTLVDSIESYFQTLRDIFDHFKVNFTQDDIERGITMHSSHYLPLYLQPDQVSYAKIQIQRRSEEGSMLIHPYPGIENALSDLKDRGARLAVWTGRDTVSAKMILKNTKLEKYFDLCIGALDVTNHKPHPEGIFKILEHWSHRDPGVVVGDHEVDMMGARDSGLFGVRVKWSAQNHKPTDLSHEEFHSVSDFHNWIKEGQ